MKGKSILAKRLKNTSLLLIICFFLNVELIQSQIIATVTNSNSFPVNDEVVEITNPGFLLWINSISNSSLNVVCNKESLPWQKVDKDGDGKVESLLVLCSFKPGETKKIVIKNYSKPKEFKKRTQAELSIKEGGTWKKVTKENGKGQYVYEGGSFVNVNSLRVPPENTDNSFYMRYEGPGWESDMVAYRLYLDWRNGIDLFGKKTPEMVLQNIGQDRSESYHSECDWGMDILKVGNSLGLGSFGFWNGKDAIRVETTDSIFCEISENNVLRSLVEVKYSGWQIDNNKIDLISDFSIDAGSRLSKVTLSLSDSLSNICTGLVKLDSGQYIRNTSDKLEWSYIATFGRQSLNNDKLGMVIFYKQKDLIELTADKLSHVVVLKPESNSLTYYLGATWEKDSGSIKTKEEFIKYIDVLLDQLNNPIKVSFD